MNHEFWLSLTEIMLINIVLSGDNAVVIAMAARSLPPHQQKIAILWGSGGAVVLRVILTLMAVMLLKVPFIQCVGGLMLVWIAYQLLVEHDDGDGESDQKSRTLMGAVKTILIADVVMSLDNTLAIAGVAKGNLMLLGLGLALSIPLVVFGSAIIMKAMDRLPFLVYIGAGLIAYTAGEMIDSDKLIHPYLPHIFQDTPYLAYALTVGVVAFGLSHNWRAGRTAHDVLSADERAMQIKMDKKIF